MYNCNKELSRYEPLARGTQTAISSTKGAIVIIIATLAFLIQGVTAIGQATATFRGLGNLASGSSESKAYSVSADGSVVVGYKRGAFGVEAFRWTQATGMVGLGDLSGGRFESIAYDVSADGSAIVGYGNSALGREAFRWTQAGGMRKLDDLPGGRTESVAYGISADGSTTVGYGYGPSTFQACRWNQSGTPVALSNATAYALRVSANGSVIVGQGISTSGYEAFLWTQATGMLGMSDLPGGRFESLATGLSADGSVVVGDGYSAFGYDSFRWTQLGMVRLGDLAGGIYESGANGVSGDGSIVVGYGASPSGYEAYIYDSTHEIRNLREVLVNEYGLGTALNGWTLQSALAISANGRAIVGFGRNPIGQYEAWIVKLPLEKPTVDVVKMVGPHLLQVEVTGHFSNNTTALKSLSISMALNGVILNKDTCADCIWSVPNGSAEEIKHTFLINLRNANVPRFTENQNFVITAQTKEDDDTYESNATNAVVLLPTVVVPGINNGNGGFTYQQELADALISASRDRLQASGILGSPYSQSPTNNPDGSIYYTLFALEYNTVRDSFATGAQKLNTLISRVKSATWASKINLVGYSKGGLVTRHYLQFIDGSSVHYCILCAVPNTGAIAALTPNLYFVTGDPTMAPIYPYLRRFPFTNFIRYPVPALDTLDGYLPNGHPDPNVRRLPTATGIEYSLYYSDSTPAYAPDISLINAITETLAVPYFQHGIGDGIVPVFSALGYRRNVNDGRTPIDGVFADELIPAFQGITFAEILVVPGYHAGYMNQAGMKLQLPKRLLDDIH